MKSVVSLGYFLTVSLIVGASATPAQAAGIKLVDTYNPGSSVLLTATGDTFTFDHVLTLSSDSSHLLSTYVDNVLTTGEDYDSTRDTLTSGILSLTFGTLGGPPNTNSRFDSLLNSSPLLNDVQLATETEFGSIGFDVSLITSNGVATVVLKRTNGSGEVMFLNSVLTVEGTRGIETGELVAAPEPGSMILLATGLAAAALVRYRRRR